MKVRLTMDLRIGSLAVTNMGNVVKITSRPDVNGEAEAEIVNKDWKKLPSRTPAVEEV